jgi:hypothetical protein
MVQECPGFLVVGTVGAHIRFMYSQYRVQLGEWNNRTAGSFALGRPVQCALLISLSEHSGSSWSPDLNRPYQGLVNKVMTRAEVTHVHEMITFFSCSLSSKTAIYLVKHFSGKLEKTRWTRNGEQPIETKELWAAMKVYYSLSLTSIFK